MKTKKCNYRTSITTRDTPSFLAVTHFKMSIFREQPEIVLVSLYDVNAVITRPKPPCDE